MEKKTRLELAKFKQAYFSSIKSASKYVEIFPQVPKKSLTYHLPTNLVFSSLFSSSLFPFIFWPLLTISLVFGLRTVILPILLPALGPERHLCICTRGRCSGGKLHLGQVSMGMHRVSVHTRVGAHMQVCTWAGMHRVWVHMGASELVLAANLGLGACPEPAHLFSPSCLVILHWSCLSPVGQNRPTMSSMSSPLMSGKEITANVLCIYFSLDANSFGDSIWRETKGPSSL